MCRTPFRQFRHQPSGCPDWKTGWCRKITIYAGMMELVDMRDLGSRASRRWGSSPHARTRIKGNCFRSCLLFRVPPPGGRLRPSGFQCSGRQSRLSAKIFACGENACAAQKRRGPEGPLGCPSVNESKAGNIDFNRPFVLGSASQKAGWVISSHNLSMNSIPQSLLTARRVINTCKI